MRRRNGKTHDVDTITKADVHERVAQHWDLTQQLPLPKQWIKCPVCRSEEVIVRYWKFHVRLPIVASLSPHRCDVSMKCKQCSAVWLHGVVITKEYYDERPKSGNITAREGRKILDITDA